ncbi:hypothetical protein [Primorskyibacter sp. 2E233]
MSIRKQHAPEFKVEVALKALKGEVLQGQCAKMVDAVPETGATQPCLIL